MFRRIVVGVDGSPECEDAVVLGAAIAAQSGAGLTLLGAFPPLPLVEGVGGDRNSQAASVRRQLSALRRQFAPSAHVTSVADGNAARALLSEAESWHASLIVLGSSRQAGMGRCAIGRTGRRLLNKPHAPLAIARRGLRQEAFALSKVAVGYDGGPESDRALQFADRLAVHANAELLIETVNRDQVPALPPGDSPPPEPLDEDRAGAERAALMTARRAATRTAASSYVEGSVGEPASVLRDVSERVDLIVIGSRRWGLLPRTVLGGVGEALASDCGASLVIVNGAADRSPTLHESADADQQATPKSTPVSGERLSHHR